MTKLRVACLLGVGFFAGIGATVSAAYLTWSFYLSPERIIARDIHDARQAELERGERELREARNEYDRWLALTHLVLAESSDGPAPVVRQHALEVLRSADRFPGDWNYGNAIHKANLALGRVALMEGDRVSARRYLLAAGDTPGSPQLNSFGPNMLLARELFLAGEREVILEYFKRCSRFWSHDDELRRWRALVKDGVEPDFGANLLY